MSEKTSNIIIQKNRASGEIDFFKDGRHVGGIQRSEVSAHDLRRGKLQWRGQAKLPNREAQSSGKKQEVLSTVKRQLKDAYGIGIQIQKD